MLHDPHTIDHDVWLRDVERGGDSISGHNINVRNDMGLAQEPRD